VPSAHTKKRGYSLFWCKGTFYIKAVAKILKKPYMKKLKIIRLKVQMFLLHIITHPHGTQWVQLLWAAIEQLIVES
jgi:hypothetical protein